MILSSFFSFAAGYDEGDAGVGKMVRKESIRDLFLSIGRRWQIRTPLR